MPSTSKTPLKFSLIAGEHSGDQLGAKLMEGLKKECAPNTIKFHGLGGEAMTKQGLTSLFDMEEVAVMGPAAILARLPNLIKRVYQCVDAILAENPDALIIIDSPEFTHPIAKRVRKKAPHIPIINYVSPTIWAWRPGRAKKMKPYVDEVLALLPFEPKFHQELGGPSCHYVGHPLIEKKDWIDNLDTSKFCKKYSLNDQNKSLILLPGSRPNEVKLLMQPFSEVVEKLNESHGPLEILLPTVKSVRRQIQEATSAWPLKPIIIEGEQDKYSAFKYGDAALAASGTVTLELALTGTPMVVAYKYEWYLHLLRPMIKAKMFALANHILGEMAFPELIQADCTPEQILAHLTPLFNEETEQLKNQRKKLSQIDKHMFAAGQQPSRAAAKQCLISINIKNNAENGQ